MAEHLLQNEITVIKTGRRKENLNALLAKYSSNTANTVFAIPVDVTHDSTIPGFARRIRGASGPRLRLH